VDIIEAGFPISSIGDFESVQAISSEIQNAVVCGLARATPKDIERAGEAIKRAKKGRIHVFCATSKIHREHKLRKGREEIIKISVESVKLARQYTDNVEFSPEDGSRTEYEFLEEIVAAVIEAGATTINIPDTVGYATPKSYGEIFAHMIKVLPVIKEKGIILSSHCHNDLGMAVANSLSAVENGARQVECTINGIGERAGNAALEEIVMALKTRADHYKIGTRIDATRIYPTSRMVSTLTGLLVQRNKAIVGENAFAHESGIHQDGVLKYRETYEIMDPKSIGLPTNNLVMGKHSGRAAFKDRITQLNFKLTDEQLEQTFTKFKALADKKKEVFDEDIEALIDDQLNLHQLVFQLNAMHVSSATISPPMEQSTATASITLRDTNGDMLQGIAVGDGPVDAIYNAIQKITKIEAKLKNYRIRAVTRGADAMGEVTLDLEHSDRTVRGRGLSTDILEASAIAYLSAINRLRNQSARNKDITQHTRV